jgi:hypothetical protein
MRYDDVKYLTKYVIILYIALQKARLKEEIEIEYKKLRKA